MTLLRPTQCQHQRCIGIDCNVNVMSCLVEIAEQQAPGRGPPELLQAVVSIQQRQSFVQARAVVWNYDPDCALGLA